MMQQLAGGPGPVPPGSDAIDIIAGTRRSVSMSENRHTLVIERAEQLWQSSSRRGFLKLLGVGGSVVLLPSVFTACSDDNNSVGPGGRVTLDLSNDTGILNYAYALEQLEAAFYVAVLGSTTFGTMTAEQQEVFTDLRNHEVIHREFFRNALGTSAIANLTFNTTTIGTLTANITNILRAAEQFEDLGVAAYNGAGKYITSAAYLTVAGKIVSVEARHAAAIRDMRDTIASGSLSGTPQYTRFAGDDVIVPTGTYAGLDVKLEPSEVLTRVGTSNTLLTSLPIGTPPSSARTGTQSFGPPSPTP